jgi:RHS repeat-associated protein
VNTKNQLLDPINNSYQYDAAGNVIFDGSHHYLYDAENRLIQVDPHSGYCSSQGNTSTAAACYVYDALGRRVAKIPASGVWTQYAYDLSGNVISEYGEGCGPTCWARGYVYFNGQRIAEYANSTTYFAHNDHLGSPRLFTDVTAAYTTDCYDFLPFGERNLPTTPCRSSSPPSPPQANTSHLFTGKERDTESSLDNFGARYMGSTLGRFMTPDWSAAPMGVPYADFGNPQSLNLYSYAKNNPTTYVDRDGHCGEPISFVVCVVVGAAAAGYTIYELHKWHKEREEAERKAYQQSYDCAMGNTQCTEGQTRAYDKERLNTYGEGAIQAIENTVPSAAPSTEVKDVVIDQLKGKVVDKMVDSAKKDDKQGPNQQNQPGQPNPNQQPPVAPNNTPPPPPPHSTSSAPVRT